MEREIELATTRLGKLFTWAAWIVLAAGIAGSLIFGSGSAQASVASCTVKAHGTPGVSHFKLHLTSDPCHRKVRAATDCWYLPGVTKWKFGDVVMHAPSTKSVADCGVLVGRFKPWGYQVYIGGKWKFFLLGKNKVAQTS